MQREEESRALAGFRFGPDPAAVHVDHALNRGQPNAGARIFLRAVQSLEWTEQPVGVGHVEARAVVAQEEGRSCRAECPAGLDVRDQPVTGEFPYVAEQIL